MKIIDKINGRSVDSRPFFSFEYFPPKTEPGLENLHRRMERMAELEPLFVDITWGAGGTTSDLTLDISDAIQRFLGLDVMMHLTCTNMPRSMIDHALKSAKDSGVTNILALRGDPPQGQEKWEKQEHGFAYASDLTSHIRKQWGDYFGIAVGGYPEGHAEAQSRHHDVLNLKKKVDAGADFIITQLFYDNQEYFDFVERVRKEGVNCPIVPGILPITNYDRFIRFTNFCQARVPQKVLRELELIKGDDAEVKKYGIDLASRMCEELEAFGVPGFHFYTLNLESSVTDILRNLGLISDGSAVRSLPWRPSTMPGRRTETVRPIFWSNRPKSYTVRTSEWDDFPNGRWGDSRSPTFGDLNEYPLIRQGLGQAARREKVEDLWGEPRSELEVFSVFKAFCEGSISKLPWCEGVMRDETTMIVKDLIDLNMAGLLTINSQPQINGARSDDPSVGWGGPQGRVYQKAYVEFFVAPELFDQLRPILDQFETISYQAVDVNGNQFGNVRGQDVNAVTWGVFPGREVVQPTVVDPSSFMIWKDEAFDLWLTDWAFRYPEGHKSRDILKKIHDRYVLVNVVENDFVDGDIFRVLRHAQASTQKSLLSPSQRGASIDAS